MKHQTEIEIYIPEQIPQRSIDVSYGNTYFELELSEMTPKMRAWLDNLIRSHHWSSRQVITGWDEPIYNQTFYAAGFNWHSYDERCALHWLILGEPYKGTHLEEALATIRYFWQGLTRVNRIVVNTKWLFRGGLFTKPSWIK